MPRLRRIDAYVLTSALKPMAAVLGSTLLVFLLERLLRSTDLLAQTSRGAEFLWELALNLTPHYVGLVLPAGFFIGLFIVVSRLNATSEIDAILGSGMSMGRLARPLVGLGVVFMLLSLGLYGYVQPISRYGYREVLHAAENAGWNGEIRARQVMSPSPTMTLTADEADANSLKGVFIRTATSDGEQVLSARHARLKRSLGGRSITLVLQDGEMLRQAVRSPPSLLRFERLVVQLPLVAPARLLRPRGLLESELTLGELAQQGFGSGGQLPRDVLLAELYSRLARALALPLMPFLAVPLALTAKRAGATPAALIAGLVLFGFQASLIVAQGLVGAGRLGSTLAIGGPMAVFVAVCAATFLTSRARPGDNPVSRIADLLQQGLDRLRRTIQSLQRA